MIYEQISENKFKSFFLVFVFFLLVCGLGYVFGMLFSTGIFGLIIAFAISIVMALVSFFSGDTIALSISGAKPADEQKYKVLHDTVEGLSIAAGVPKPKVYVMPDTAINAFATGRDPKHSSIAVTTGAIEKLSKQELEGVIAHEMSHVKNFDIRLMMLVVVLVGVVAILSDWMTRSFLWGGGRRDDDSKGAGIFLIIGLVLAILAPIIAQLIRLAISRKREYLADASGAMLTRYPQGLADALRKIGKDSNQLKTATNATAHMYIANPFKKKGWLVNMFSTHPPLEDRLKILDKMSFAKEK
jgi:heat shock protein HtpX